MSDDWDAHDWEFGQALSAGYKKGRQSMLAERDAAVTRAEAAEAERDKLRLAILGGEDAPGYADSVSIERTIAYLAKGEREQTTRAEAAEAQVAALREALAAVVARSENGELGTSKVQDMARIARTALAGKEPADA